MLHVQKYLREYGLNSLIKEFGIKAKIYDDRVVLNYKITGGNKFHPIIKECRGLILSLVSHPKYEVLSRTFDRFFNLNEGDDKDTFNWDNCIVFNKLDGSLMSVYADSYGKWNVSTRGTAFAEATTPMGKPYRELFDTAINNMPLEHFCKNLYTDHTYIFELTSSENRIVTRYNETNITLLGIRNNITGDFIDYSIVNSMIYYMFPEECSVALPDIYNLSNPNDIVNFVESMEQLQEGVVCFDNETQTRIKMKNSQYVAIHRLKGEGESSIKSLVKIVFDGEYEEFLIYFPEYTENIMKYINAYNNFREYIDILWNNNKYIDNQKEFALNVKDTIISSILFSLKKGNNIDNIIDNITISKKIELLTFFL